MLDISFLRENPEKVKEGVVKKGYNPELVERVLEIDKKRVELLQKVDELRGERNKISEQRTADGSTSSPQGSEQRGREVKEELKKLEPQLNKIEEEYNLALREIPNLPLEGVPVGASEKENVVRRTVGSPGKSDFTPRDHTELGKLLDVVDFERAAKVSGSDFYFLKNDGVLLELALVRYGLDFLVKRGYVPFLTPDLAHERFYLGTGYLPRGPEAQTYTISDSDLGLIATSEVTLAGLHADESLEKSELPKKYAGYSHCFRVEAGSYGKYSKGLYRVHQFTKVEMFALSTPQEGEAIFEEILANQEAFWKSLEVPYRVVEMCTGDLGAQAARKIDIEAWMPGRDDWGEVTSSSNTTDYQARNLNIKYREGGKLEYAHTLNGTLVAVPRAIIAILENYQQKDGSVIIPDVLRPFMGKDKITA